MFFPTAAAVRPRDAPETRDLYSNIRHYVIGHESAAAAQELRGVNTTGPSSSYYRHWRFGLVLKPVFRAWPDTAVGIKAARV